ncbi:MAG: MBL fold metallo-hydrolase [Candidatus Omnitrophica bacterium]|nr:MBL fold metallo-hydrolase [Candidatus Omnitrophota bacterium]
MFIKKIVVGPLESNCYLAGDEDTKEIYIIDPGGDYKKINSVIDKNSLKPKAIINTHGHGDHIGANKEFGIPVWIHSLDADFLTDSSKNLSGVFGFFLKTKAASRLLKDGDILDIGKYNLEVIHTPGHTPGSICLKTARIIFTGDTLFCEGVGRTDFAYGSQEDIISSIKEKLFTLDDDYVIYPGHGPSSTIRNEKINNPFIV